MGGTGVIDNFLGVFTQYIDSGFGLVQGDVRWLAGVLIAVYLAVETANRLRLPRPAVLYVALIAALALAWLVPQESLLALPVVPRFLAGCALAFAPIYLANLIFAQRFSGVETAGAAFAAGGAKRAPATASNPTSLAGVTTAIPPSNSTIPTRGSV